MCKRNIDRVQAAKLVAAAAMMVIIVLCVLFPNGFH